MQPTVLAGVTPGMRCFREETFGPVAPVCAFGTESEALRLANDTPYGLAAYLFTADGSRIMRMTEELQYGIVGVNDALPALSHQKLSNLLRLNVWFSEIGEASGGACATLTGLNRPDTGNSFTAGNSRDRQRCGSVNQT